MVVAHDRHLLKACADQLWLVADGAVREFDGDLDDYKAWARDYARNGGAQQRRAIPAIIAPKAAPVNDFADLVSTDRKQQKRVGAEGRQRIATQRRPLEQKLAALETRLKGLTSERDNLQTWLTREDSYADENKARLQETLKRQGEVTVEIESIEWQWFELQQKLEAVA